MSDFTPYQQKIIKRYYDQSDRIKYQRLSELAGELYLASGKKQERLWQTAAGLLADLGLTPARIEHITTRRDPALVAEVLKELDGKVS